VTCFFFSCFWFPLIYCIVLYCCCHLAICLFVCLFVCFSVSLCLLDARFFFFFLVFVCLLSVCLCVCLFVCLLLQFHNITRAESTEAIPPTKKDYYATKADIKHLEGVVAAALENSCDMPTEVRGRVSEV
jgi:hypothetical protein